MNINGEKIFSIMLAFALVLPFSATQVFSISENEINIKNTESSNTLNGNIYEYEQLVTNGGWPWTSITKTITKNYNSINDVPASVHYTEYIDGKWYGGELKRTGDIIKISNNIWQATFTGKINY